MSPCRKHSHGISWRFGCQLCPRPSLWRKSWCRLVRVWRRRLSMWWCRKVLQIRWCVSKPICHIHVYLYKYLDIHTYIHTYIHTSIHPYIHTSIHPCIHASTHPCLHASIHLYICLCFPYVHVWCIYIYVYKRYLHGHLTYLCKIIDINFRQEVPDAHASHQGHDHGAHEAGIISNPTHIWKQNSKTRHNGYYFKYDMIWDSQNQQTRKKKV